jgi:hypothetical protein
MLVCTHVLALLGSFGPENIGVQVGCRESDLSDITNPARLVSRPFHAILTLIFPPFKWCPLTFLLLSHCLPFLFSRGVCCKCVTCNVRALFYF